MKKKVAPPVYEPHTCRNCSKGFWGSGKQKFCKKCEAELRNSCVPVGAV